VNLWRSERTNGKDVILNHMSTAQVVDLRRLSVQTGFFGRYKIIGTQYQSGSGEAWHINAVSHPSLHHHEYWVSAGKFRSARTHLGSTTQIITDNCEELDCQRCEDVATILNRAAPTIGSEERLTILEAISHWERNPNFEAARQDR
jgi:hypothetical protein